MESKNINLFRGTDNEIQLLARQHRIINYGFYFAWDTGTFYLGSSNRTLQKYGSNKDTLNTNDIKKLVNNLLVSEINIFIEQIKNIEDKVNSVYDGEISNLKNVILDEVISIINNKVDNLDLTPVNTKLDDLKHTIDVNNAKKYVQAITGDDALRSININNGLKYYYILDNSTDINNTFIQGNTYLIDGLNIKNITENAYIANNYIKPIIRVTCDSLPKSLVIGQDLIENNIAIKYDIDNTLYLRDNLRIYVNDALIVDNIDKNNNTVMISLNLHNIDTDIINIKIVGEDVRNNTVIGSFDINVLTPIYYGADDSKILSNEIDAEFNKLSSIITNDVFNSYNIDINRGQYIWFLLPESISISTKKFYADGFSVPMELIKTVNKRVNNVDVNYNCYRTTYALNNGQYNIEIRK